MKDKNFLYIGQLLKHKFRGWCTYSKQADFCEDLNPDPTSLFVEFPNGEIEEISIALIEEH